MKNLITWQTREPVEENGKKTLEIENERRKKGESWTEDDFLLSTHFLLSEPGGLQIVDVDESRLAKWISAYNPVFHIKISPIMSREEFAKAIE
ncbi:MAG: hypothetical protein GTO54_11080 [Nitrososphaeria archaeon]|nr:hypothetical protein [Nitrososphaeria archaeon]